MSLWIFLIVSLSVTFSEAYNLFERENIISTENTDVRVTGRAKRDVTSYKMADHYDVTWILKGRETRVRLYRADLIGDLVTRDEDDQIVPAGNDSVYRDHWAVYDSEDIDGVFLLHRHLHNDSAISVEGYFLDEETPLLIQPLTTPGDHAIHTLNTPFGGTKYDDAIHKLKKTTRKVKRNGKTTQVLEVDVYADLPVSVIVAKRVGFGKSDAFLQKYYAMLIAFMNKRMQTLTGLDMGVVGVGFTILKRSIPGMQEMTHNRGSDGERKTSCDDGTLDRFGTFMATRRYDYDSALLLTGYDLLNPQGQDWTGGISFVGYVCRPDGVAIAEYLGTLKTFHTASHELGHVLGADHDGERKTSTCKADHNYIMRASNASPWRKPQKNWWLFSPCSTQEIRDHIAFLARYNVKCLSVQNGVADVLTKEDMMYGSTLDLKTQCHIMTGRKFLVHATIPNDVRSDEICWKGFWCNFPEARKRLLPYPGTRCGRGKWCRDKECVSKKSTI